MRRTLSFVTLVFVAAIASALLHEFGHCVFYWLQGVPAAMSLVKEFPLRDITASEYAVGSAGGPFANVALIVVCVWLYRRFPHNRRLTIVLSAFLLANAFYFVLRGLIALLKGRGGELGDIAGLVGLGFEAVVILYGAISLGVFYHLIKLRRIKLSAHIGGSCLALFVGYIFVMVGVETVDRDLFWHRFPTVQIDDGRTYNEHR